MNLNNNISFFCYPPRPVRVIRLIAEDSVEESIWQNAEEKLRLEEDVTGFDKTATDTMVTGVGDKRNGRQDALISDDNYEVEVGEVDNEDDEEGIIGVEGPNGDAIHRPQRQQAGGGRGLLLQGEIFKFLADALNLGGSSAGGIKSPRVNPC